MSVAFVIPVHHGDLLLGSKDRFNVVEEIKPGRIKVPALIAKLEGVRDQLKGGELGDVFAWFCFLFLFAHANCVLLWSVENSICASIVFATLTAALRARQHV
jgi:hypothetical protein